MDMNAYTEMKSVMGDVFIDVINTFLEYMPEQISALDAAVSTGDTEQVFAVAHRIKSSSGSIGALGLAAKAEALELKGREGESDGLDELLEQLKEGYDNVVEFLKQEVA